MDLRDVPLRLPERADRRRDLLAAWQTALWAGSQRMSGPIRTEDPQTLAGDLGLVGQRTIVARVRRGPFPLAPGDRALVAAGESVVVGAPIAERLRDPRLDEVDGPGDRDARRKPRRPA